MVCKSNCCGENLWPHPRFVAHRAAGKLAPENTMAAFRACPTYGFQAIETDAVLSKDKVLMLFHDKTFGRTVKNPGNVSDYTAKELQAMDAGSWFSEKYAGEPIATMEEAVKFCQANNLWMNIEIKPIPGFETETATAVCEAVRDLFKDVERSKWPLLSSFQIKSLEEALRCAPDIERGLLLEGIPENWLELAQRLQVKTIHPDWESTTEEFIKTAHAHHYGVMCYTVDDKALAAKLFGWGTDAICTNRLDFFKIDLCISA